MKITLNATKPRQNSVEVIFSEHKDVRFIESSPGQKLSVGCARTKYFKLKKLFPLLRKVIRQAKIHRISHLHISEETLRNIADPEITTEDVYYIATQSFVLANYEYTSNRTEPKDGWPEIVSVQLIGKKNSTYQQAIERGRTVAEQINSCRELCNTPGGDMTPQQLLQAAKHAAKSLPLTVSALGKKEMTQLKMGAILGVARGSIHEPKLIMLEYRGGSSKEAPVALVGKGVTYDTGGLSIKPAEAMVDMYMDMSGGAAVIHALALMAKLKVKRNVIGIVAAVENAISGDSYRPGDVLTSLSGKTIEILNTDAEGRVILADAVTYAHTYKPSHIIDVATLTGASLVALGQRCSAILTRDDTLREALISAGEKSGDLVWPLPLWEEYDEEIRGTRGDITNIHNKGTRYAGTIHGGLFIQAFAKKIPFAHIDMAPRMESIPSDQLAPGATGEPIRLLLQLVEQI